MSERGQGEARWVTISSSFPARLNRDKAETKLEDGETPDAYGQGLDRDGYLYAAAAPTGVVYDLLADVTAPANAPATVTARYWHFFFSRLFTWDTGEALVRFGAPGYESDFIRQSNSGRLWCDTGADTSNVTGICPFAKKVAVFKDERLYIVDGASSLHGQFSSEFATVDAGLTYRQNTLGMWNQLVFVNSDGVFVYDGEQLAEVTRNMRGELAPFSDATCVALKGDWRRGHVMLMDATDDVIGVVSLSKGFGLFDYSTAGFRFTTPSLQAERAEPLLIDKLALIYKTNESRWNVKVDVKINDTWYEQGSRNVENSNSNGRVELDLNDVLACRRWAMRITELDSSVYISEIQARVKTGGVKGYSAK